SQRSMSSEGGGGGIGLPPDAEGARCSSPPESRGGPAPLGCGSPSGSGCLSRRFMMRPPPPLCRPPPRPRSTPPTAPQAPGEPPSAAPARPRPGPGGPTPSPACPRCPARPAPARASEESLQQPHMSPVSLDLARQPAPAAVGEAVPLPRPGAAAGLVLPPSPPIPPDLLGPAGDEALLLPPGQQRVEGP